MGQTDFAGMGDMCSFRCVYVCRSRGWFWQVWAYMGKGGQVCMGQTDQAGMGNMSSG